MKICTNCGASNGDDTHVCRKCGAILPVSSTPPRLRINFGSKSTNSQEKDIRKEQASLSGDSQDSNNLHLYGEMKFFSGTSTTNNSKPSQNQQKKEVEKAEEPDLSEIPLGFESMTKPELEIQDEEISSKEMDPINFEQEKREYLKEIDPIPFDGSFLRPSYRKQQVKTLQKEDSEKNKRDLPSKEKSIPINPNKQKRLARDMKDVLSFLSEKLPPAEYINDQKPSKKEVKEKEKIEPSNVEDILKQLTRIDSNIEASAIIKNNGRIMASAISDRASESLFSTIAQNLYMIGSDIIEGLNAGTMLSISLRGTDGVLDLAPIKFRSSNMSEYILIIFANPRIKSGIIVIASAFVKKQLRLFYKKE